MLTVLTQQVSGPPQDSDSRFLFSIPFQRFKFPAVVDVFTSRNFNLSLFIISEYRAELAAQAGRSDLSEIFEYVGKSGKQFESIVNWTHRGLVDIQSQLRRSPSRTIQCREKPPNASWAPFLMRLAQLNPKSMVDILPVLLILKVEDLADLMMLDSAPEIPEIAKPLPQTRTIPHRHWTRSKLELIFIPQISEPDILTSPSKCEL
eukprot:Gregarina_sp_Poly_1__8890@NODE_536_length_7631_cov_45_929402_g423_i0_p3_GENE_NODE_536_length_7631_cov_45_929402_g423_i0NODE_536_length_7631_cov_45_929402_g423_i0_p3_ORF_typecomplete_len205_score23_70_NODE_536_length_7631_cov_45_929402_g423_i038904504